MWLSPDEEEKRASRVDSMLSVAIEDFKNGNHVQLKCGTLTATDVLDCVWDEKDNDLLVKSLVCFMNDEKEIEQKQILRALESKVYNFLRSELEKQ